MTTTPEPEEPPEQSGAAITYCGVCSPEAGPFDRLEAARHMRDVHPDLSTHGAGPPWNNGRQPEGEAA